MVIFLGGAKTDGGKLVPAKGVLEEFELARASGAFLLPVAATGGAAKVITDQLLGSALAATGAKAIRPTDEELQLLSDPLVQYSVLIDRIINVLSRVTKSA
ncbi:hypothetical protein D3C85_1610160 [compost metagenome]